MGFKLPDRGELQGLAAELGRPLDDDAAKALLAFIQPFERAGGAG